MKPFFVCICIGLFVLVKAQNTQHVVKAGENLSTIANQYKVSVASILAANNIHANALVKIGQKLIIPITGVRSNVTTTKPVASNSKQYVVVAGDNLSKIARLHGITENDLRNWNNISGNLIKVGQVLNIANTGIVAKPVKPVPKPEQTTTESLPTTKPVIEESKPTLKPSTTPEIVKPTIAEPKPKEPTPTPIYTTTISTSVTNAVVGGSFFEQEFKGGGVSSTLNCKSFKTSAGWQDKKYYALTNLVEAGTIIKITANNKTTYAKVLGVLPDTNNNTEIPLRISSATAQQLGLDFNAINQVLVEY